ncbi:hypothetical protein WME79_34875 [Sorangium sp. So ce726]|uniref:hypothetical protein n=1 Tax=Sorangium sp. So ce726 TaxID=3133319 RepID=UPI003F5F1AF5
MARRPACAVGSLDREHGFRIEWRISWGGTGLQVLRQNGRELYLLGTGFMLSPKLVVSPAP